MGWNQQLVMESTGANPFAPWDWYVYLHKWLKSMEHLGNRFNRNMISRWISTSPIFLKPFGWVGCRNRKIIACNSQRYSQHRTLQGCSTRTDWGEDDLLCRKITGWNLEKRPPSKRKNMYKSPTIFGFHVNFRGCRLTSMFVTRVGVQKAHRFHVAESDGLQRWYLQSCILPSRKTNGGSTQSHQGFSCRWFSLSKTGDFPSGEPSRNSSSRFPSRRSPSRVFHVSRFFFFGKYV